MSNDLGRGVCVRVCVCVCGCACVHVCACVSLTLGHLENPEVRLVHRNQRPHPFLPGQVPWQEPSPTTTTTTIL